jgi:hypothetical protein
MLGFYGCKGFITQHPTTKQTLKEGGTEKPEHRSLLIKDKKITFL